MGYCSPSSWKPRAFIYTKLPTSKNRAGVTKKPAGWVPVPQRGDFTRVKNPHCTVKETAEVAFCLLLCNVQVYTYLNISKHCKEHYREALPKHIFLSVSHRCIAILGSLIPFPGKHYWEVEVEEDTEYRTGVAFENTPRHGHLGANNSSWCMRHIITPSR